jgi:hypothetical protein
MGECWGRPAWAPGIGYVAANRSALSSRHEQRRSPFGQLGSGRPRASVPGMPRSSRAAPNPSICSTVT